MYVLRYGIFWVLNSTVYPTVYMAVLLYICLPVYLCVSDQLYSRLFVRVYLPMCASVHPPICFPVQLCNWLSDTTDQDVQSGSDCQKAKPGSSLRLTFFGCPVLRKTAIFFYLATYGAVCLTQTKTQRSGSGCQKAKSGSSLRLTFPSDVLF